MSHSISDKLAQQAIDAIYVYGAREAERKLGIHNTTVISRANSGTRRGLKPSKKAIEVKKRQPKPAQKAYENLENRDKLAETVGVIAGLQRQNKLLQAALDQARNAKMQAIPTRKYQISRPDDESTVVIPDSHGKFMHMPAVMAFLGDLKRLNPHRVIMLGDHVDCGGFLAQNHTWGYVAEADYTYEDDIKANNWFLDEIQKAAPRAHIEYLEGNHEARVERWCVTECLRSQKDSEFLRKNFAPEFMLHLKQRDIPYYRRSVHYDGLSVRGCIKRGQCFYLHELAGGRDAVNSHLRAFGGSVVSGTRTKHNPTSPAP